jgi:hypothetical protein
VAPLDAILDGTQDAFVSKLNADGSTLIYSTYLGGSDDDYGNAIAVDRSGNAYVSGLLSRLTFRPRMLCKTPSVVARMTLCDGIQCSRFAICLFHLPWRC